MQIDKQFNGLPANPASKLWFEEPPISKAKQKITRTPRIGIDYAGPIWAKKPYRFILD